MSIRRLRLAPQTTSSAPKPRDKASAPSDFARALGDALNYLYDPAFLQTNPLARLAERDKSANAKSRGEALRLVLLSAIEGLRPEVSGGKHPLRCHELLTLRYVEGLEVAEVQKRLVISRRQYYREHERALEALLSLLHERLGLEETPAEEEPLRLVAFPEPPVSHLPAQPGRLIGREDDLARAKALLLREEPPLRLLTLTGPGGSGKTRLALALAQAALEAFPAGAHFVDLSPTADPSLVLPSIARVLGVREEGNRSVQESLSRYLSGKALLLVLDNCEQVAAAAPQIGTLLEESPHLKVLATSRQPLRIRWEQEFLVPPLAVPEESVMAEPKVLAEVPSVDLFVERTRALKPDFLLTQENARPVAEICRRLDGLPLAIELAAARSKILPPLALLRRLESRLDLLTGGSRDLPERQQTMRSAIAWSYDLLGSGERHLFRRLGVFAGGCTLESAAAVAGLDPWPCLDTLSILVDASLLQTATHTDTTRFALLETIRAFALEQLRSAGDLSATRQAHLNYYLGLAEAVAAETQGPAGAAALDKLEREHDNLRAALQTAMDLSDGEAANRIGAAVWELWRVRGYLGEGLNWLGKTQSMPNVARTSARASVLCGAGAMAAMRGEVEAADRFTTASISIAREVHDTEVLALALCHHGIIAWLQGDKANAVARAEEALAIARESNSLVGHGHAYWHLHTLARAFGDVGRAELYSQAMMACARKLGNPRGLGYALQTVGAVELDRGDTRSAAESSRGALSYLWQLREVFGVRWMLLMLGKIAWLQGAPEQAVTLYGAAAAVSLTIGADLLVGRPGEHEAVISALRQDVAPEAFRLAWEQGKAMSLEQAVAYALVDRSDG